MKTMLRQYVTRSAFAALSLLALVFFAVPLRAQLVAPADANPLTAAHWGLSFYLNLNPVPWDLVERDTQVILAGLERQDPALGKELQGRCRALLGKGRAGPLLPGERRALTRDCFELVTRAVARLLMGGLPLKDTRYGTPAGLEAARALWPCFAPEIQATDPAAFTRLSTCWNALSAGDAASKTKMAGEIAAYLESNFGAGLALPEGVRLAALPVKSAGFNHAMAPVKLPQGTFFEQQAPRPRQELNMVARGVDEADTPLVAFGDMCFDSAQIFGEPARSLGVSCASCHNRGVTNPHFFIPGLSERKGGMDVSNAFFAPHANNGHYDHLDIPDLRGIRFTAPYGRNGRNMSLRDFTRNVIVNEFNGPEPDPVVVDGLVAYMLEFDFLANPSLEKDGTLKPVAPEAVRRGEALFRKPFAGMNGRSCASCHIPDDHFLDHRTHDIGSVPPARTSGLDAALDTPTLLGAQLTAPYFHDGSLPTLAAVTAWFDEHFHLGLTPQQRSDLTAYVETIGSGEEPYEPTPHYLAAELEEFSFFLSSYEFLKATYRWDLVTLMFKSVADEVRFHQRHVTKREAIPIMEQLAGLLDEARAANKRGAIDVVDARLAAYRKLYKENLDRLK
jgi:cytochrome c peroxidase